MEDANYISSENISSEVHKQCGHGMRWRWLVGVPTRRSELYIRRLRFRTKFKAMIAMYQISSSVDKYESNISLALFSDSLASSGSCGSSSEVRKHMGW